MNNIFDYLIKLYKQNKEIVLLSWFYATVAVLCFFIAGICALINQSFGVALLIVPLVAMTALCANVTVWALIRLFIQKLEEKRAEHDKEATKAQKKNADKK